MTKQNQGKCIMCLQVSCVPLLFYVGFLGGSALKNPPAMKETQEMWVQPLGQEDPLEKGNTLQYPWLENHMDRRAWWATVHGPTKSQTWLKRLRTHTRYFMYLSNLRLVIYLGLLIISL